MTAPDKWQLDVRLARRRCAFMLAYGRFMLRPLARLALGSVWRLVQVPVALLLLFLEWGWQPLSRALGLLRHLRLVARFEAWVVTLPPYPSLAVFALPAIAILPLKIAALWLIAHGHAMYAALLFVGAKIVGTALVARLFVLLQPKLMSIGWFKRGYDVVVPWKERVFAAIRASWGWRYGRMLKARAGRALHHLKLAYLVPLRARGIALVRQLIGASSIK